MADENPGLANPTTESDAPTEMSNISTPVETDITEVPTETPEIKNPEEIVTVESPAMIKNTHNPDKNVTTDAPTDTSDIQRPDKNVTEESPVESNIENAVEDVTDTPDSTENAESENTTPLQNDDSVEEDLSSDNVATRSAASPPTPVLTLRNSYSSPSQEQKGSKLDSNQSNDADMLESVLHHVGSMGRYQKLLFLAMMPFGFFFAFLYFVQMFIDVPPENYWCKVPELAHLEQDMRRYLSAPGAAAGGSWDSCRTFDVDWTQVLETMQPPPEGTPTIPCQHGWDFEFSDIPYETVVTERGWVCEYASYGPIAQAIFFAGSFCGSLFFGWVADTFGRVPAIVGSNMIGAVGGIATIFTRGLWDFILCRFFTGMALDNAFMAMYILVLEYVGARHRTWVANMSIALYFGGGCMTLPWIALWMNDWRKLLWITSLPMFIVLLVPFIVPESTRWLVSQGRVDKAVAVLKKFERVNGTKIPEDVLNEFVVRATDTKQKKKSLLVLFKSPLLRNTLMILLMVYMTCCVTFDALIRMSGAFGLDFFIAFTLTSATEIPSITILTLVLDRWGRRNLTAGPLGTAGVLTIVAMFVPLGIPQASLAIAARFFINMSFNTVLQWVTELLPTPVRASGSAMMHTTGYIAIVISPFIVYSEVAWSLLPLLILGLLALIGSTLSMLLPETMGLPMPMTVTESEWIVKEKSLCRKRRNMEDVEGVNNKEKSFDT